MELEWIKNAYTIERKRCWIFWISYKIIFEESTIYNVVGGPQLHDEIKQLAAMLNGAYNMGNMRNLYYINQLEGMINNLFRIA